jgi:peptidoglycan/LPS O-acetylase OafA/YrhL
MCQRAFPMNTALQSKPNKATGLFSGAVDDLLHPPPGQIPFLDGLRTIAVMLVVNAHCSGQFALRWGPNWFSQLPVRTAGWIGVDLFFVLSGFFIGGQLWREIDRTSKVDVGRFILRRGFRIWPLYFFIFLSFVAFSLLTGHSLAGKEYGWSDLVFLTNYSSHGIVMGSWSLCTEEQFYIVVPLCLALFAPRVAHIASYRRWLWIVLAIFPVIRAAVWVAKLGHFFVHSPLVFSYIYFPSITHCDGLITGLIISNLVAEAKTRGNVSIFHKISPLWILAAALVLGGGIYAVQREVFDFSSLAIVFAAVAWYGIRKNSGIFNAKIFYWISRLSFGMYLNHEYFCPWMAQSIMPRFTFLAHTPALANMVDLLLLTSLSIAIALVTFCLVEHPFLQMRKRVLGH